MFSTARMTPMLSCSADPGLRYIAWQVEGADMGPASQQASDTAVAGVIARPPFLYLAGLFLGVALDRLLPLPLTFPEVTLVRWTAGGGLIAVGLAIMAAGIRNFSRAATP